jgi:O-antigen/teichoic acid export membrane protein
VHLTSRTRRPLSSGGEQGSLNARRGMRTKRAVVASVAAAASRAVGMGCQLVMVPLMLRYLGNGDYGIWLTLQGLLGFVAFADFGIGSGTMNGITQARARGDWQEISTLASSAVAMLSAIGGIVVLIIGAVWYFGYFALGVNTPPGAGGMEAGSLAFALYFAAILPVGFVERLVAAFQDGAIASGARIVAAIATLAATWAATRSGASFPQVCVATLVPTIAIWGVTWWLFLRQHASVRLRWSNVSTSIAYTLLRRGLWFFVIQACATLMWSSDNLLISMVLGPNAVPAYAVPQRLFGVVLMLTTTLMAPLWPAYADAEAHGDTAWMHRMLVRSFAGSLAVAAALSAVIAIAMPWLLRVWVGEEITASPSLSAGLGLVTTLFAAGSAFSMYLNGRSHMRLQVVLAVIQTTLTLGLRFLFLPTLGTASLPWITAGVYICLATVPVWWYLKEALAVESISGTGVPDAGDHRSGREGRPQNE